MIQPLNPLARGFYTVRDAARLIEVGSASRIRGWLNGYADRAAGPLLVRDYKPVDGSQELSFFDLMEVRFVEHFRSHGVKPQTLRQCLITARKQFGEDKPLLKQGVMFIPTDDRRKVIVEEVFKPAARDNKDTRLWNLVDRNYEFNEFIEGVLARGLTFDPATQMTATWTPRPVEFPQILINPRIAYGQPIVPAKVPTLTLYEAWKAEAREVGAVADWHNIPANEVQMAIGFEQLLDHEATALAA